MESVGSAEDGEFTQAPKPLAVYYRNPVREGSWHTMAIVAVALIVVAGVVSRGEMLMSLVLLTLLLCGAAGLVWYFADDRAIAAELYGDRLVLVRAGDRREPWPLDEIVGMVELRAAYGVGPWNRQKMLFVGMAGGESVVIDRSIRRHRELMTRLVAYGEGRGIPLKRARDGDYL